MGGLVVWIIVGGIAGFLASKVLTGKGMGLLMDVIVGILGGFLGGWLAGLAHIGVADNVLMEGVVAFVGAVILLVVFRALTRRGVIHA